MKFFHEDYALIWRTKRACNFPKYLSIVLIIFISFFDSITANLANTHSSDFFLEKIMQVSKKVTCFGCTCPKFPEKKKTKNKVFGYHEKCKKPTYLRIFHRGLRKSYLFSGGNTWLACYHDFHDFFTIFCVFRDTCVSKQSENTKFGFLVKF